MGGVRKMGEKGGSYERGHGRKEGENRRDL